MRDPNAWQPLSLALQIVPERTSDPGQGPDVHRPPLGSRDPVRVDSFADRYCRSIPVRRPAWATPRPTRPSRTPRSRSSGTAPSSTRPTGWRWPSARRASATTRSGTNDGNGHDENPATGEPYAPDVGAPRRLPRGRSPSTGPTGRTPRRRPATGTSSPTRSRTRPASSAGSAAGAGGRPTRVGRQDLLRPQRRRPRRGHRRLGPEGFLRLGAADLDDPLHGRQGTVERSGGPVVRPGRPSPRARPRRGGDVGVERAGRAPRGVGRPRR